MVKLPVPFTGSSQDLRFSNFIILFEFFYIENMNVNMCYKDLKGNTLFKCKVCL